MKMTTKLDELPVIHGGPMIPAYRCKSFDDKSHIIEQEDGSYIIAREPELMPEGKPLIRRVHDAERYYWHEILKRTDELTVEKLGELYERDKGSKSA